MAIRPFNSVEGYSVGSDSQITVINAAGNVTATNLTVSGVSNLGPAGNVKITGGTSGQVLSTDGAGNLSFTNSDSNSAAPMPYQINTGDSEFEKLLGELRPLYDVSRKATDTAIDKEVKDGIYKDKKSYEIPGSNNGLSYVRQRMQNDKIWTPDLEKKYQKMKAHMTKMHDILKTVVDAAQKVKNALGA
jgi:hypothetical protein